jgi:hypothetical protein
VGALLLRLQLFLRRFQFLPQLPQLGFQFAPPLAPACRCSAFPDAGLWARFLSAA